MSISPRDNNIPHHLNPSSCFNNPSTSWSPIPVTIHKDSSHTPYEHSLSQELLKSVWPEFHQPPTTLAEMNPEDTAIWLEMLAKFKGWEEAKTYAHSFKSNDIAGCDLQYLSVKALKCDLEIVKLGHRLEIISAIKRNLLTLMNPTIVSLSPNNILFQSLKTTENSTVNAYTPSRGAELKNPWKENKQTAEPNNVLSVNSKKQRLSMNAMNFGEINNGAIYSGVSDPDFHGLRMFEEIVSLNSKYHSNNRMIIGVGTIKRDNVRNSEVNSPYIPPIDLPPPMIKLDERERELDESLSSIFLKA